MAKRKSMVIMTALCSIFLAAIGCAYWAISNEVEKSQTAEYHLSRFHPELTFGDPSAPVTVIEYSSIGCYFCSRFYKEVWPALKKKYVDSGKVYWIVRPFCLGYVDLQGYVMIFSQPDVEKNIHLLHHHQDQWIAEPDPLGAMTELLQENNPTANFPDSPEDEEVISNALVAQRVLAERDYVLGGTPGFIVGGTIVPGLDTQRSFENILDKAISHTQSGKPLDQFECKEGLAMILSEYKKQQTEKEESFLESIAKGPKTQEKSQEGEPHPSTLKPEAKDVPEVSAKEAA